MRAPLFFLGPNGPWDLSVFKSAEEAKAYAEPVDVIAGEYGDHGWDADGCRLEFFTEPAEQQPGAIGRFLGLGTTHEVWVRESDGPRDPKGLRDALTGRLAGLDPNSLALAGALDLDELIVLVERTIDAHLQQVKKYRPWN